MRLFFIVTVLFCSIGCSNQRSCEAYSQCDELYMSDYNCNLPQRNIYTPTYNTYGSYYPNTQTVYYYPVYIPVSPPCESPTPTIDQRPTRERPRPTTTQPRPSTTRNTKKQ